MRPTNPTFRPSTRSKFWNPRVPIPGGPSSLLRRHRHRPWQIRSATKVYVTWAQCYKTYWHLLEVSKDAKLKVFFPDCISLWSTKGVGTKVALNYRDQAVFELVHLEGAKTGVLSCKNKWSKKWRGWDIGSYWSLFVASSPNPTGYIKCSTPWPKIL